MAAQNETITITDTAGTGQGISGLAFGSMRDSLHMVVASAGRGGGSCGYIGGSPFPSGSAVGIIVGTGTNAVAAIDNALQTPVADGTSASTLEYFTCAVTNFATAGTTASFDIERLFRNSSGGSITINEVGIYAASVKDNSDFGGSTDFRGPWMWCLVRDIVSPGFAVANGEYMRIIYTLSVTA